MLLEDSGLLLKKADLAGSFCDMRWNLGPGGFSSVLHVVRV